VKVAYRTLAALTLLTIGAEAVNVASGHLMDKSTQYIFLFIAGTWTVSAFVTSLWRK